MRKRCRADGATENPSLENKSEPLQIKSTKKQDIEEEMYSFKQHYMQEETNVQFNDALGQEFVKSLDKQK